MLRDPDRWRLAPARAAPALIDFKLTGLRAYRVFVGGKYDTSDQLDQGKPTRAIFARKFNLNIGERRTRESLA